MSTAVPTACPDDDQIDRFIAGSADETQRRAIWEHLPDCPGCRQLVSELARDPAIVSPPEAELAGDGPLLRGTAIGRYLVIELVGAGAMGRVYSAYDPQLDRRVALKILKLGGPDPARSRVRMLREAQAMARLRHPNVVAVHDAGESGARIHIAMELVEGRNLRAWLAEAHRPWRDLLAVLVAAGRGLAAAHAAGLVHRDFKPDNVLIAEDGRVLVGDFGMASLGETGGESSLGVTPAISPDPSGFAGGVTRTGALMGTPAYMPPEQLATARVDPRADIYAFAVTAWECLLGEHPFPGKNLAELRAAVAAGRPREPAGTPVPRRLRRALAAALASDPAARPPLASLLAALAADPRRRLARAGLVVAAVAALVALVFAGRAALLARAAAQRAESRAASATRIGQELKERELRLDEERLLPLHDLRPAEARVRDGLDEMRALLDGTAADASVHDAIGRELVALGDDQAARVELETALALGAGGPDLHWVLGFTLVRLHDGALDEARRMGGPRWVAQRQAALDAEYLPAARAQLEAAAGTSLASPGLVSALLAYQRGDLDEAVSGAEASARSSPVNHRAQALVGQILLAEAEAAAARDPAGAEPLLDRAIEALEAAALIRRSDADLFDALARAWLQRLTARRWGPLAERLPAYHGALLAAYREIAVAPDRGRGYTRLAQIQMLLQAWLSSSPILADSIPACIAAGEAAAARDPLDALARDTLGNCLKMRANLTGAAGADPTAGFEDAAEAFLAARIISPGFPWAANDLCGLYDEIASVELEDGRDARPVAIAAVSACREAVTLDPEYLEGAQNLAGSYPVLLAARARYGVWDEAADVERRAAEARVATFPGYQPGAIAANRLIGQTARLQHEADAGRDPAGAAADLDAATASFRATMPAAWAGGEPELMLLEAEATHAVVGAERGGGPADRAAIERCLAIQPLRFECRALAVRADLAAGDLEAARARAAQLAADLPRNGRGLVLLAEAERRLGHVDAGLAAARAALARAPDLPAAHALLGELLAARDPAAALAALDRAVGLDPLYARRVAATRASLTSAAGAQRSGAQ